MEVIHSKSDKLSDFQNVSTELSPELHDLARAIRCQVERTAEVLGRNLLRARQLARHGEWLPFLDTAGIAERTAQRLMGFVRTMDAGERAAVSLLALLDSPTDIEAERATLKAWIDELEAEVGGLSKELAIRKMFPTAEARIKALEAEVDALRSTAASLQREIDVLKRQKRTLEAA